LNVIFRKIFSFNCVFFSTGPIRPGIKLIDEREFVDPSLLKNGEKNPRYKNKKLEIEDKFKN
jgi:hypothetical protein